MVKLKLIVLFLFVCYQNTNAQTAFPVLNDIVTDQAGIMSSDELAHLKVKLSSFETAKSHQIVVLTIQDLQGESIEDYALKTFNKNKLGQKDNDNGLLILFSKNDRKVRLEVGYGLEPIITDAISSRIIRDIMIPEFKENRYYEGIDLGTSKIIEIINDPKYAEEFANQEQENKDVPIILKIIFGLFITAFLGVFIVLGLKLIIGAYKQLINLFRGLIIGKVGVFAFPFMLIGSLFSVLFAMPFIIMPLGFLGIIFSLFFLEMDIEVTINHLLEMGYFNAINAIVLASILLLAIPLLVAFFKKTYLRPEPFKLSFNTDKKYTSKHLSSFGVSHSSSRSSSSSSSHSNFSGGGGSSGGGGASGSW